MKNNFNWGDNVIDSRDIISRHEDLHDEHYDLEDALQTAIEHLNTYIKESQSSIEFDQEEFDTDVEEFREAIDEAQEALDSFNQSYEKDELDTLTEVIAQGEDSPDWNHGETLIREEYFVEYTKDLIEDTCEVPEEFSSGKWPWTHMSLDYEAAAEELKQDYMTIDAGGETYYIRA